MLINFLFYSNKKRALYLHFSGSYSCPKCVIAKYVPGVLIMLWGPQIMIDNSKFHLQFKLVEEQKEKKITNKKIDSELGARS